MSSQSTTVDPYDGEDTERFQRALRCGEVPIAVYGLGKVGLPLAAVYAERTGNVIGVDIDSDVIEGVNEGEPPFDHEPGLPELLADCVRSESLLGTTDGAAAATDARIHVVIVPVPLAEADAPGDVETATADLSALRAAARDIGAGIDPGDLVLVESTVPPGTCRTVVTEILEAESSLDRSEFGVAFSPERVSSGRAIQDIRGAHPRVVGGIDEGSTGAAAATYRTLVDAPVFEVTDAKTAETVKLFEGVYRDVNIALANELGQAAGALGVDVLETIDAANTQPFSDIHQPGAGVGGHCIPYYPYFLLSAMGRDSGVIRTARAVNEATPSFVVQRAVDLLDDEGIPIDEATVAVLGLAYRPGIPETSASPAGPIIDGLRNRGAGVFAVDPVVESAVDFGVPLVQLSELGDRNPDAVVLVTAHDEFDGIDWTVLEDVVVVDGRDALGDPPHPTYTVGRGFVGTGAGESR